MSGAAAISSSFGLKAAPHRQYPGLGKVRLILEPTERVQSAIGKRVTILDFPGGCLVIRYKGVDQPTIPKLRQDPPSQANGDRRKQTPSSARFRIKATALL
jgi:hypothetical protein